MDLKYVGKQNKVQTNMKWCFLLFLLFKYICVNLWGKCTSYFVVYVTITSVCIYMMHKAMQKYKST